MFSKPAISCNIFKFDDALATEISPKFKISFPEPPSKLPFIWTVFARVNLSLPSFKSKFPFMIESPFKVISFLPISPSITFINSK